MDDKKTARMFAQDVRQRERKQYIQMPFWQTLSFILHVVGFIALVIFTPLREIIIPERKITKPEPNITAKRIEQLSDAIQTVRLNEILDQLNSLQIILHNMDKMKNDILTDYDAFAMNEAGSATESIDELFKHIISEQETAIESERKFRDNIAEILQMQLNDFSTEDQMEQAKKTLNSARPEFPIIDAAQANAQNLMDKTTVEAQFLSMEKTAEASAVLRDTQLKVNTMQREFQKNLNSRFSAVATYPKVLERIADNREKLEKNRASQKETSQKISELRKEAKTLASTAATLERQSKKNEAQLERNKQAIEKEKEKQKSMEKVDPASKERLNSLIAAGRSLESSIGQNKKDLNARQREITGKESALKKETDTLTRQKEQETKIITTIREEEARRSELAKVARAFPSEIKKDLADNIRAQEELAKKTAEVAKLAEAEKPKPEPLAQETFEPDPLSYKQLGMTELVEAYETAKLLEDKITESYRDIKAAETAILRRMSFEEASRLTDVVKVVRPDINKELVETPPRTQDDFEKLKTETMNAVREADNMVDTSEMLMVAAIEIVRPETLGNGADKTQEERLRRMYDLSGLATEMEAYAAESEEERIKDLSEIMAQAMGGSSPQMKESSKSDEHIELAARPPDSSMRSPADRGLEGFSNQTQELFPGNIISLEGDENDPSYGVPTKWVYINSWYVIGPFPNPDRINLRRKFAPESVVDLEATYIGKNNKPVKWEFEQAMSSVSRLDHRAPVIPQTSEEYGIWYAYAEVFVDKECDLWLAVGSDDRSDIWLNGLHVWGSSNELKVWRINEGFRKVRFKEGRNKVLARVENGWHAIAWSVCIALTDDVSL
jgi:hypothetical protein